MERIISLILGYVIGCIQTAYIVGKTSKNIDIRQHGSGNSGTTNALRVLGFKAGLITFLGDFLKAIIAVTIIRYVYDGNLLFMLYTGLGVVLGHNFPFYMGFKGGKGIAATVGTLLAFDYRVGLVAILIMIVIIGITRYVSLGSIIMSIWIPVSILILYRGQNELLLVGAILMALAIIRHKDNIVRLIKGTENKLGKKKTNA